MIPFGRVNIEAPSPGTYRHLEGPVFLPPREIRRLEHPPSAAVVFLLCRGTSPSAARPLAAVAVVPNMFKCDGNISGAIQGKNKRAERELQGAA